MASPKITTKQFSGYKKALKGGLLNGVTFNDNWNLKVFGITQAQFYAI